MEGLFLIVPGKPKHSEALRLIKITMGQLKKVQDMIENNEYCPNIPIQLLAVISILKKANTKLLQNILKPACGKPRKRAKLRTR